MFRTCGFGSLVARDLMFIFPPLYIRYTELSKFTHNVVAVRGFPEATRRRERRTRRFRETDGRDLRPWLGEVPQSAFAGIRSDV